VTGTAREPSGLLGAVGAGGAPAPGSATGRPGLAGLAVGAAAGLAVFAPVLGRGFVLSYDMVFVPRPPITAATLGIDGSVPRAVPTDLVVALLARLLPADLVQQALLLVVFVLAGWGVGRLAPAPAGGAAAAAGYVWNPYVAERLVLGHWAFLLGYALLPWVAGAALAVRREGAGGRPWPLLAWLGAAALAGSTAGLIATGVALAILGLRPAPTRAVAVLTFALAVNAPWWLPGLARPGGIPTDPAGVGAFGARADSPLGVVGSLATLGGIWNPAVWPAERRYLLLVLAALAGVAAALALGWRGLLAGGSPGRRGLVGAGAAGFLLALAGGLAVSRGALTVVVWHVPGGGLLRDGQKYLAPTALVLALAAGHAVERLAARRRGLPYAVLLGLLPVLVLPSLAAGAGGRLAGVHYPASWTELRAAVAAAPPGDVAALPWGPYRRFGWNGDRVLLDPLPRLLPRPVAVDDDLPLSTGTVRGEDPRAAQITAGLQRGADLAGLLRDAGVRYAVVHRGQPGAAQPEAALAGLPVRYRSADLLLVDLLDVPSRPPNAPRPRPALLVGLGMAGLCLVGAFCRALSGIRTRRLLRSPAPREPTG